MSGVARGTPRRKLALAVIALAAVSCVEQRGPLTQAPRRMPSARTPRPVVALSFERGEVRVTTASWLPSSELFGRFVDPGEATARLDDGKLVLEGAGATVPPHGPPPGADPVGPWCDSEVRPGSVENEAYVVSWASHGPVTSKLRFNCPHGSLSATYAEVAFRKGGAAPSRFALSGGLAIANRATGKTWRFLRGRGPESVERALAEVDGAGVATRKFPSNRVSSVWLSGGEAWVGTFDAGLCLVDLATNEVLRPPGVGSLPREISTVLKAGGIVFAGSYGTGLWALDTRTGAARRVEGVLGRRVNRLLLVGDLLWVATDAGVSVADIASLQP